MRTSRAGTCPASRTLGGATLMEVMITLTILAIVMGIVLPSFLRTRQSSALKASARDVLATLRYARSEAIVNATPHRFVADTSEGSYWIETFEAAQGQSDETGYVPDTSSLGGKRALREGVTIAHGVIGRQSGPSDRAGAPTSRPAAATSATGDQAFVTFTPGGTADPAVLWVQNQHEDQVFIEVDPQTAISRILTDDEAESVKGELKID